MKKKYIIVIVVIILFVYVFISSTSNTNKEPTFTTEIGDADSIKEPEDETLSFYPTIEEALGASEMSRGDIAGTKKIVKVIEKNNRCDVFFINTVDEKDGLYVYKLKEKSDGKQTVYSEAIFATGVRWNHEKIWLKELSKRYKNTELLEQAIQSDLFLNNSNEMYNLGEGGGQVRWGLYNNTDIENMTINGEAPTEIMELSMDGEKAYFWYYENLELPINEIKTANIKY